MQLIVRGVVDLTHNSDLFTTVIDMLAILIHSTLINDRDSGDKSNSGDRSNNSGAGGSSSNVSSATAGSGTQSQDRAGSNSSSGMQNIKLRAKKCY